MAKLRQSIDEILIILNDNKIELEVKREIKHIEAIQFIEQQQLVFYKEVSIKEDINIIDWLDTLNKIIYFNPVSGKSKFHTSNLQFDFF